MVPMKRIGWNENISLRPISDLRFQIDLAGWYSCFKDNRVRLNIVNCKPPGKWAIMSTIDYVNVRRI